MAQRILEQSRPVTSELDRMIFQMETTLGKAHTRSPFDSLYEKYSFNLATAPEVKKNVPAAEEEKKGPTSEAKEQRPIKEKAPPKEAN